MTMSAKAKLDIKQLVTFCIVFDEATIQITIKFPKTAMTDIEPYKTENKTMIPVGTWYIDT